MTRKRLIWALMLTTVVGFVVSSLASVKKRDPDKREVESILKKIGGDHYQEGMKIREVGMIKTDVDEEADEDGIKAYYWVYCAVLDDDAGYHLIFFDNEPRYLGYYKVTMNPMECGEKRVIFNQGDLDLGPDPISGDSRTWSIAIPDTGPPKRVQMNMPTPFVEAPTVEEVEEQRKQERQEAAESASPSSTSAAEKIKPEYRPWKVTFEGSVIEVESAIFVEYKGGRVTIKDGKTGRTVTLPVRDFSEDDQRYLRQVIK